MYKAEFELNILTNNFMVIKLSTFKLMDWALFSNSIHLINIMNRHKKANDILNLVMIYISR